MIKKFFTGLALGCALAISSPAASAYVTLAAPNGRAASPAYVVFPAKPGLQLRLVNVNFTTDTNNAVLSFSGGSTAYSIVETNALNSSVTNKITSTNGLTPNGILVLQHGGVIYTNQAVTWNSSTNSGPGGGTNVVLASGGWGVSTTVGDTMFLMDTPVTIPATASAAVSGDAIYVANLVGRPVKVTIFPALGTNSLNSVVAKYE